LGLANEKAASKFYDWRKRYGCVNEHNGWVPRDFWLEPWEKEAIIGFHLKNPLEGYVAVSPASVWRVLKQAGLLSRWKSKPSRKGTGFEQPLQPHQRTGTSTFATSIYAAPSITCAAFWMGSVVSSCIGICVSECEKLMSR